MNELRLSKQCEWIVVSGLWFHQEGDRMIHLTMKSIFHNLISLRSIHVVVRRKRDIIKLYISTPFMPPLLLTTALKKRNKIKWKIEEEKETGKSLFSILYRHWRWGRGRERQKGSKGDTLENCLIINYGHCYEGESGCLFLKVDGKRPGENELVGADVNFVFDIKVPKGIWQWK